MAGLLCHSSLCSLACRLVLFDIPVGSGKIDSQEEILG